MNVIWKRIAKMKGTKENDFLVMVKQEQEDDLYKVIFLNISVPSFTAARYTRSPNFSSVPGRIEPKCLK